MRTGSGPHLSTGYDLARLAEPIFLTVVIPAFNEERDIRPSYERISAVIDETGLDYEFIFVDDGSADGTWSAILDLAQRDPRVRALRHRANSGKASALANAFAYARGNVIATCDADLQYEPRDVLRVIDKMLEGCDAVSARKVIRRDPLSKRLPSWFFNSFVRATTGVQLHDVNAGLKAYRCEAARELVKYGYGELHRFFIVLLVKKGFSVAEVPVQSLPRVSGRSKYGAERYLRGAMDFLTVFFLSGYVERPLHLFGGFGTAAAVIGGSIGTFALAERILSPATTIPGPLLEIAALLVFGGMQLLVVGLVAEMVNNLERGRASVAKVSQVVRVERRLDPSAGRVAVERRRTAEDGVLAWHEAVLAHDRAAVARAEEEAGAAAMPGSSRAPGADEPSPSFGRALSDPAAD